MQTPHNRREFGRPVINTDTVRKMDRSELEEQLATLGLATDEQDPDDRLRDDLMIALTAQGDT
jgi:hypothetical protein